MNGEKPQQSARAFNKNLLSLYNQLVIELGNTEDQLDLLRQKKAAITETREGLLQLESIEAEIRGIECEKKSSPVTNADC